MRYKEIEVNDPRVGRDHSNMLFLMGHSGAGKSYLATQVSQRPFIAEAMDVYNVGDEIAKNTIGKVTKDEITNASFQDVSNWLSLTLGVLTGRSQIKPLLVTAHYPYVQKNFEVTPEEDYLAVRPSGYVFVYAEPEQIHDWGRQDTARSRPEQSVSLTHQEQRLAFLATQNIARQTGARMITVWNRGDNVEENVNKIEAVAQELFAA